MNKQINVAFFGDSICVGQGISIHKGWVTRISENLERLGLENDTVVSVDNKSINGNTTRMALERMPYDIQGTNYTILMIQFGINDCNHWETDRGVPRVSPLAFEANLNEMIDRAMAFDVKKVFLNTNHPTLRNEQLSHSSIIFQDNVKRYNDIIRKVTDNRNDVQLNDVEGYIFKCLEEEKLEVSDIVLEDKLHISLKGHDMYFDFINPILSNYLQENMS